MKRMKKVLAVMLSLCMMFTASCMAKLTVQAEGATTYTLKVVDDEWRFQPNYPWDSNVQHRELYYMHQNLKDGDKIVVSDTSKKLDLTVDKKLSNVTIEFASNAVIAAPGYEEVYVLNNSAAAINGDVDKAYVYEASSVNFNSNVNYLEVNAQFPLKANVGVMGTLNHLKGQDPKRVHYELYNFAAGKLSIVDGEIKTDSAFYSTAAGATVTAPVAATTTVATPSAADELDDVPKTGDIVTYYWILGLAVVCLVIGIVLKVTSKKEEK